MSSGQEDRDTNGSFDMAGRDRVSLSAHERQTLAHLEARIRLDDPSFAVRMRGRSWRWVRQTIIGLQLPAVPTWAGTLLLVLGLVGTVAVVGSLPWLSILTLGIAMLGALRVGVWVRGKVDRARSQRRSDS